NPTPYFITIAEAKVDNIDILNERITLSPFKNYSIKNKKITKNIKDKKVHWKRVDKYEQTIIATPKELIYE
ncbi:molecular chaperone, partial [Proteus mirabilis]